MKKAIVAKKLGMTQVFDEKGAVTPVTVLLAGPCVVAQVKTVEKDGYSGVQLGFGDIRERLVTKPVKGHYAKLNIKPCRTLKEFRLDEGHGLETGAVVKADVFAEGDKIDVTGISKGHGYQGAIKRFGQSRGPMTHGSKYHRHAGAMRGSSTPGRVMKNKHLPGHMGHVQVTTQNLTVVKVDAERNLLLVKGAVPGPKNTVVYVKDTLKR